jgi:manganese/zinc/iron transport system substrate-binding protein
VWYDKKGKKICLHLFHFFGIKSEKSSHPRETMRLECDVYRILLSICVFLIAGCEELQIVQSQTRSWMHEEVCIRVLCTTEYVSSLVKSVGREKIVVLTLIAGQNDPHSYQLVKGDDAKFRRANIVFYSGLNLEQGAVLDRYLRRPGAFAIGDYVQMRTHEAIVSGSVLDPHMWNDLHLWSYGLFLIAEKLSELAPQDAAYFQSNAREAFHRYQILHDQFRQKMQSIDEKRRYFVTTHDAFEYFCRAYIASDDEMRALEWKKRLISPEGLSPESQISTKDIAQVVEYILAHDIHTVFSEVGVNGDAIQKVVAICRERGCDVVLKEGSVYSDSLGPHMSYEEVVAHNIDVVAASFIES